MRYYLTSGAAAADKARGGLGARCCDKAVRRACVCRESWTCPDHGDVCVGSHD